jgi:hypothetical protein
MKKIELSQEITIEILTKFQSGITIRKLAREYPYSFAFIQKLIQSNENKEKILLNYPQKDEYYMIAICKETKKEFNDYKNESGALTEIVFKLYPEESKKSKYLRKSKEYSTGKFWYDDYFTFEYRKKNETKKCYYCDWTTEDIVNSSGAYEKHLLINHKKSVEEYLRDNALDKKYFKHIAPENGIICKICGKALRIVNHKHLKTHNISVSEYKVKFGDLVVSLTSHEKLKKAGKYANKFVVKSKTSKSENELKEFLINNGINILQSTRKYLNGSEIDLYSPTHRIGIEYNGNLYHTELYGKKNFSYHINKTKIALNNGIMLYHIQEDEYESHPDMVKNKLLYLFGKYPNNKIHARKCDIRIILKNEKSDFLNQNHIQGDDKSTYFIGAFLKNTLYAVMTFDKNRFMNNGKSKNDDSYELTRFAVKNNIIINGIGSRLLKHFIQKYNPSKIISFADRRWTPSQNDNLYTKMGFTCIDILKPDYSYYNKLSHRSNRLHKFGFGKSALKKRYPNIYDDSKTEWEMMQELGYDRIWDCGKFKYELNIKQY